MAQAPISFRREEGEEDGIQFVRYIPESKHPWLKRMHVINDEGAITVEFEFRDPRKVLSDAKSEKIEEQIKKIEALHDLLERGFGRPETASFDALLNKASDRIREMSGAPETLDFKAGPTSNIKSVLTQSDLPRQLQEDILKDLQVLWAKSPG